MYLKRVQIQNYRNYSNLKVSFNKGINIIYGNNAQGKTNLLEAIYVLALTNTFKSTMESDLVKYNKNYFKLSGVIKKEKLDTLLEVMYCNNRKILSIDKTVMNKVSEYISALNVILFTPDDLDIIKGPPLNRRNFLNIELSQLYRNYYILLNEYNKVLKTRNEFLKLQKPNKKYLDILTEFLIEKNIAIYKIRKKFINKINLYCEKIFYDISGLKHFKILYKPNFDYFLYEYNKNKCLEIFSHKYKTEYKSLTTFYGVHKDDFEFYLGDINLKNFGSQGQQRLAILALKLSEIEIFKNWQNTFPILLLDDVFSEIDKDKSNKLMNYLNSKLQVIITTVSLENFDNKILSCAKIFNIENGKLKIQRGDFNE